MDSPMSTIKSAAGEPFSAGCLDPLLHVSDRTVIRHHLAKSRLSRSFDIFLLSPFSPNKAVYQGEFLWNQCRAGKRLEHES